MDIKGSEVSADPSLSGPHSGLGRKDLENEKVCFSEGAQIRRAMTFFSDPVP